MSARRVCNKLKVHLMIYNHYLSATNVTLKTYLSPLESLFWNDFMGHIERVIANAKTTKPLK